jgi:hypothetical protein
MKKISYLLLVITIVACNQNKDLKKQSSNKISVRSIHNSKILLSETKLHVFSDTVKKDTFKLLLKGKTIKDGKGLFEIVSFDHKRIYSEQFQAVDLLGDLIDFPLTDRQKEDTITYRFRNFFLNENFTTPALNKSEVLDTDYVKKEDFEDIKPDASSTGFIYALGYEGFAEIAWSKKRKKVVVCSASD